MLDARTLTTADVARFQRGQMEIRSRSQSQYYCGEIVELSVVGNELVVRFAWIAVPNNPHAEYGHWTKVASPDLLTHTAPLHEGGFAIYTISEVGAEVFINSQLFRRLLVLYPREAPKLRWVDDSTFWG